MRTRVLAIRVASTGVLAAGVVFTAAPAPAPAMSDFCESLGNPAHIRECNCGADNAPGTPEYQACLHGAAAPGPAKPPANP